MVVRIQLRHDIASAWTTANPILLSGEVGVETDTSKMKIGIGQRWDNTPYFDERLVHTIGDEVVRGEKSFTNNMVIGTIGTYGTDNQGNLEVHGNVKVDGEIDGVVYRAYEDDSGNVITDYYQKKLEEEVTVSDGRDWNEITEEGIYSVDVDSWNTNEYHDPSEYDENMAKQGMLIIHKDRDNHIIQQYIPLSGESGANYTTVTRHKIADWTAWLSQIAFDTNTVHTTGNESINGIKTFGQKIKSSEGTISLSENASGEDAGVNAKIQRAGENFIRKESTGELYLSANQRIYLRPNGDLDATNQVIIDNNGQIDGKCLKDGNGNVITTTYATKSDLQTLSIKEPEFIDKSADIKTYNAIRERKRDTLGDYIDIIKKNNYTVVGSLTIDTGVATGFSNANYITVPTLSGTSEEVLIQGAFVTGTDLTDTQYVYYNDTDNYFRITNSSIDAKVSGVAYNVTSFDFEEDMIYTFQIELSGAISNMYINGEIVATSTTLSTDIDLADIVAMIGTNGTSYFKGYIDLNAFRISKVIPKEPQTEEDLDIYEAPIYQPCLQIPYTASKFGVKIVDGLYADRIQDCYNQFRTGNYFILDVDNNKFRLPFDSPNGLNHMLYNWRSGNQACSYDTNLECTQMAACTSGTPVVFHKPFADNEYSLVGISYSSKTATGFTPSESGYYMAQGRITLG